MPIELYEESGGKHLAIHVSAKLAKADFKRFVPEFERLVRRQGTLRVLFDLSGFAGWETDALWDEIKFDAKHVSDIDRLAVVGEKKWQREMTTCFKPFTKATVRYFDHTNVREARAWLDEAEAGL